MKYRLLLVAVGALILLPSVSLAFDPMPAVEPIQLGWSAVPGPVASEEFSGVVAWGEYIYTAGYWHDPRRLLSRYHPNTLTWERVAEISHDSFNNGPVSLEVVSDQLYVVDNENLARYDAASKTWQMLARQTPIHRNSNDYAVAGAAGKIYLLGGKANVGGGYVNIATVDAYDPQLDQWQAGPSLPEALMEIKSAVGSDGTVYVAGQRSLGQGFITYALTPGADQWILVFPEPVTVSLKVFAALGGELLFISPDGVRRYNLITGTWRSAPAPFCDIFHTQPLLNPQFAGVNYSAATWGSNLYLFGGVFNSRFPRRCDGSHSAEFLGGVVFILGPDQDSDHLLDSYEALFGSDPRLADTDGDHYLDYQEVLAGYSPAAPSQPLNSRQVEALRGKILIDVEGRGQLWYVEPTSGRRFALSTAADIIAAARSFGVGISERAAAALTITEARRKAGIFFIHTERRGELSYLDPRTLRLQPLPSPVSLAQLAKLAIGVRGKDLAGVPVGGTAMLRFRAQQMRYMASRVALDQVVARTCALAAGGLLQCASTDLESALWKFFVDEQSRQ